MSVSNKFKQITKQIKQQEAELSICAGGTILKEIQFLPVKVFNEIPLYKLKERKDVIAKELKYSFDGQLFKTIMKQIEITVKNANEIKEKDINFKYGLLVDDKYEYIDLGNFFIKDIEDSKKKDEMTVTGYDRMIRFMKNFKQSELQLTYPCKMLKLVQRMCEVCGVELFSADFYNADLDVTEDFFTVQELTYRDVLEKIAQATLTTAFIEENKLNLYKVNDNAIEKIDKSYLTDLTIKENFGPVNALVLGRGDVEDNVEEKDQDSIKQNGRCEIRFDENEFIEFQREKVIEGMFEQVKGLEYYSFEASDVGIMWLNPCACIELGDREDNLYKSYYLKANITINTGITSDIEAEIPETTETEYKVTTKEEKKTLKVERLAKKNEGLIQDLIQETTEHEEKLTKHEQTMDSITDKVSNMADLTRSIEGIRTISLENCIKGNLLELHIKGNNTVFESLKLSDNLYLSDDLYLKGDSLIVIKDQNGKSKEYELNIQDTLRQNGTVYDEYILKEGKAQVIRRINADGTIKDKAVTESLGTVSIMLEEGNNTLSIKNYTAEISAKWAIKSEYSEVFATNVKMDSEIKQTAQEIDLSVNKKLEDYSITTEMNSAINMKADEITSSVSKSYATKGELTTAKSEIKQTTDNITSTVSKKVGKDEIISQINQSAEKVCISADKIDINGKAAKFKTQINQNFGTFTKGDNERIQKIIMGEISATQSDYDKYDIDKDGRITGLDYIYVLNAVSSGGTLEKNGVFEIDPYSSTRAVSIYDNKKNKYILALGMFQSYFRQLRAENITLENEQETSTSLFSEGFSILNNNNRISGQINSGQPTIELYGTLGSTTIKNTGIQTPVLTQTSLELQKKNFEMLQDKAIEIIKNIDIYKYNLKSEKDTDKKHIGFVIGDNYNYSKEVTSLDNTGVDNYSFTSLCCKAIQEQQKIIEKLQNKIEEMEEKINGQN